MKDQEKYQRKFLKLKLRDLKREASSPPPEKEPAIKNRNKSKFRNNDSKVHIQKEIKKLESKLDSYDSSNKGGRELKKKKERPKDNVKKDQATWRPVHLTKIVRRTIGTKTKTMGKEYQKIEVAWKDAIFDDGFIKIRLEPRRFLNYPYHHSRSTFDMIKPLIIQKNIEPLIVEIVGSRIYSIENLSLLSDVIQYLKVQKEWNLFWSENSGAASNIIDALSKISPKTFDLFYKHKDLTPYLALLCELQSDGYRVIPVMEEFNSKSSREKIKDSFLFTAVRNFTIYIIWESTEERKATYIFKSSVQNYENERQKIFDYISTAHDHKRTNLKLGVTDNDEAVKAFATLNHTGIKKWKEKLIEKIGLI